MTSLLSRSLKSFEWDFFHAGIGRNLSEKRKIGGKTHFLVKKQKKGAILLGRGA